MCVCVCVCVCECVCITNKYIIHYLQGVSFFSNDSDNGLRLRKMV